MHFSQPVRISVKHQSSLHVTDGTVSGFLKNRHYCKFAIEFNDISAQGRVLFIHRASRRAEW